MCANGLGVGLSGPRASFLLSSSKLYSVERRTRAGQTVLAELGWVCHRLVGLVVRASASRAEDPGIEARLRLDFFSGLNHTSDLNIGTPVAALPGAWRYRVSAGTGRSGVSIL